MKLYGNIKSERAEKGQGGNDFLNIKITNDKREEILSMEVAPGDKIKITVKHNEALSDLKISDV